MPRNARNRAVLRLMLALTWAACTASGAQAEVPFVAVNPGAPIWNGSVLFNEALATDIVSAGCRAVRINFRIDGNATWTAGHLAQYDAIIQTARNHNLHVLGLICYEAVQGSQAQWNENYDTTGLNAYTQRFADNAWLLINRYKNDIKLFEIWNEPDCWSVPPESNPLNPGCYYIWPKNYSNLLAETYKKCLAAGGADFFTVHGISLSTGGLFAHDIGGSFSTGRTYMTQVYSQTAIWDAFEAVAGRRYPWDYFGYHFYLDQGGAVSTSRLAAYFNDIRAMKTAHGDASPFLVTEFGWNTQSVSLELQADNLRDTYDWMRTQSDIEAGYWYQWNNGDGGWGLVYSIGHPKPSYYAFAAQCQVVPPPRAYFSAEPTGGHAPLSVQFTDRSTGQIDTYQWDFGDNQTSDEPAPLHVYSQPGSYSVALQVSGPGGSDTLARSDFIVVTRPPHPADLNGDRYVDAADLAIFLACMTGPGELLIPPGCDTGVIVLPPPVTAWAGAAGISGLPTSLSGEDSLHGLIGHIEAGGFHPATPGGTSGGLAALTSGQAGTAAQAVLSDFPGGEPANSGDPLNRALQVRYDFASPRDLAEIRVFAANVSNPGNGRVFQNYDVWQRPGGAADFYPLAIGVTTGPFGRFNAVANTHPDYLGATLTQIVGGQGGPIALDVASLRVIFYPVSDTAGWFRDQHHPGEPGDIDGHREAFESSIIKEIDVFAYTGPPPSGSNRADLDGDGDVDLDDFGIFQACLTGPSAPASLDCLNRPAVLP